VLQVNFFSFLCCAASVNVSMRFQTEEVVSPGCHIISFSTYTTRIDLAQSCRGHELPAGSLLFPSFQPSLTLSVKLQASYPLPRCPPPLKGCTAKAWA